MFGKKNKKTNSKLVNARDMIQKAVFGKYAIAHINSNNLE